MNRRWRTNTYIHNTHTRARIHWRRAFFFSFCLSDLLISSWSPRGYNRKHLAPSCHAMNGIEPWTMEVVKQTSYHTSIPLSRYHYRYGLFGFLAAFLTDIHCEFKHHHDGLSFLSSSLSIKYKYQPVEHWGRCNHPSPSSKLSGLVSFIESIICIGNTQLKKDLRVEFIRVLWRKGNSNVLSRIQKLSYKFTYLITSRYTNFIVLHRLPSCWYMLFYNVLSL